jgi:hypothetical protein
LRRAISVLGDTRADAEDREDAANVVRIMLPRARPTEADLADVISALERALHVSSAVRRVLMSIRSMSPVMTAVHAGHGVERIMARVHRDGDHEALAELLVATLDEHRWRGWIRDEWRKAAMTWATNRLPESTYCAARIIEEWLCTHGVVPGWMAELAEAHPDLISSSFLSCEAKWRLHSAAPTVHGWRSRANENGWTPVVELALFGEQADIAMQTLRQAIGESTDEAARLRLHLWFRELTGTAP